MANVQPGDLAIVVNSPKFPTNIGKIVRVVGPAPVDELGRIIMGPNWVINNSVGWIVWQIEPISSAVYGLYNRIIPKEVRVFPDRYLRKLSDLDDPCSHTEHQELELLA